MLVVSLCIMSVSVRIVLAAPCFSRWWNSKAKSLLRNGVHVLETVRCPNVVFALVPFVDSLYCC